MTFGLTQKILCCALKYAATLPSVCLWIDTEVHQKSRSFTLAETTMSSNCEIHLTTEMINTIETGIDICLFPIIGIGIGIGFKLALIIGIGFGIGKFLFWTIDFGIDIGIKIQRDF